MVVADDTHAAVDNSDGGRDIDGEANADGNDAAMDDDGKAVGAVE